MRVHHLNCGSLRPPGGRWVHGDGPRALVCHCLLIEGPDGLVLVDTGFGRRDVAEATERLPAWFRHLVVRPVLDPAETAERQIRALGFRAEDVTDIVLTHLDLDHAGGVLDFPGARVHVTAPELDAATRPRSLLERRRYHPEQWRGARWRTCPPEGEAWNGLRARALPGLPPEILLVPLPGHTRGHAGVAVRSDRGWLLHCGDAYFARAAVETGRQPSLLGTFERLVAVDRDQMEQQQERLGQVVKGEVEGVRAFCTHDAAELASLCAETG